MKARWVRLAAIGQVLFFLAWAGWEERRRSVVTAVVLETVPVDPRDVLSGDYLVLRYSINRVHGMAGLPIPPPMLKRPIAVRLAPVELNGRRVWRAVQGKMPAPELNGRLEPDGSVWVAGTWLGRGQVRYGIERYYFSEKRQAEMNAFRPGAFFVEAGVDAHGKLFLRRLLPPVEHP